MAELTDRPTLWRGCGYEAHIWVRGRRVDAQSAEGRAAIDAACRLVFRPYPPGRIPLDYMEHAATDLHSSKEVGVDGSYDG